MAKTKPTSPKKATTQQFIEIEDIRDDIMLMRDHSAVTVMEVGAVNFWLLSAEDQMSMIYTYGSLLNSLSFPVQIVIISKMMNIAEYIEYLNGKIDQQKQELIKKRLSDYREFIKQIVKKNTVLEKRFFFAIPFNPLEMGASGVQAKKYGKEYLPDAVNVYEKKSKTAAQDAHEAIRPVDVTITPEYVAKFVEPQQAKLYELIWNRFVASQMTPASYAQRQVVIKGQKYTFRATGSTLLFDGFLKVWQTEDEKDEDSEGRLPDIKESTELACQKVASEKHKRMTWCCIYA